MKHIVGFLLIFGVLLLLAAPLTAQEATPAAVGLRPDAPTYAVHVTYWVGYKPIVIGEGTDRQLDAHLWYPAINPSGLKEEITYAGKLKDAALPADLVGTSYGHALLNAPTDISHAPYPLIVFSHGFGVAAPFYVVTPKSWTRNGLGLF